MNFGVTTLACTDAVSSAGKVFPDGATCVSDPALCSTRHRNRALLFASARQLASNRNPSAPTSLPQCTLHDAIGRRRENIAVAKVRLRARVKAE